MRGGLLHFLDEDRSALDREARGLVGGRSQAAFSWRQKGLGGFCASCVQDSVSIVIGESIYVTILFVSIRHCISLKLGYNSLHLCHSVIPYGYVC